MKVFYTLLLVVAMQWGLHAQSEKSLEETKFYIVKVINEHGFKEKSTSVRLRAEFDGDLLRIVTENKIFKSEDTYNFLSVYRYKGPIRRPGDRAYVVVWVDRLVGENQWKKADWEFDVANYDAAEQLMKALRHLNELLIKNKPAVEKF